MNVLMSIAVYATIKKGELTLPFYDFKGREAEDELGYRNERASDLPRKRYLLGFALRSFDRN